MANYLPCLLLSLCLSSCIGYRPVTSTGEKIDRDKINFAPIEKAYVTNRDTLGREYRILRHSGLYELVEDPNSATVEIELQPLRPSPIICLTSSVTFQAFTLGFYPVPYPANAIYSYVEKRDDRYTTHTLNCSVDAVVSWFHLFSPKKNKKKALGRAFAYSYRQESLQN